jgi:methyl-accepting chemotaxis protein
MKLTVRGKIILVCGVLLGATALSTTLGIYVLAASNARADEISRINQTAVRLSAQLRTDISKTSRAERDLVLADGDIRRKAAADAIDRYVHDRDDRRRALRALGDPAITGKLDELDAALRGADELDQQIRDLAMKASNEHATVLMHDDGRKESDALQDALRRLDAELSHRPVGSQSVAARAQVWQALRGTATTVGADHSLAATSDEAGLDGALAEYNREQADLAKLIAGLDRASQTPEEHTDAAAVGAEYTRFRDLFDRAAALGHENADGKAAVLAQTRGVEVIERIGKLTDDVIATETAATEAALAAADSQDARARALMIAVFVLALGVGIALTWTTLRYISSSLRAASELARAVSHGDLTQTATVTNQDEIGTMVVLLNEMVSNLRKVATDVTAAAASVATGAEELSATAGQVAQGASEQGAATEQTTAAMEQMGASVQQNADNAQETDRLASKASADADTSGQAVSQTLSAMKDIAEKISIIEEIARKTDLLALNAAVEAARAGDHGRGFAVVASEVRKLAERSATAAGQISEMSRSGVSRAETAGDMLSQLVPGIRKTAELVQEVSAASREQNTGIEQSNKALQDLDRVTQQNAAAAEQLAATAGELSNQAQQLHVAVSFFQLDAAAAAARGPGPEAPSRAPVRPISRAPRPQPRRASGLLPAGRSLRRPNGRAADGERGVDLDLSGSSDDDHMFERH